MGKKSPIWFMVAVFLLLSSKTDTLMAFEGLPDASRNCSYCHFLSTDAASKILKTEVTDVMEAPIKGFWKVKGLYHGKSFYVYIDYRKKYVIPSAALLSIDAMDKPQELKKIDISMIPTDDAILMGSGDARIKIIVFDDPDCPYCRRLHHELKKILKKRGDIAFLIKLYPLDIHPEAYKKSKAILCDGSVKILNDAMAGRPVPEPSCETNRIDENIALAEKIGIDGTPTLILPDGRLLPGFVNADTLINLLDSQE